MAGNVKSPVNRRNLPTTCGACHVGPFVAFQDSRHYQMLEAGQEYGPTCSTCHETVGGRLLSPKALEGRCGSCHGLDEIAPRAGRPQLARRVYERLAALRVDLKAAQGGIKKIADPARRAAMLDAYGQAEVPLIRAVNAGHRFVYDELLEQATVAEKLAARCVADDDRFRPPGRTLNDGPRPKMLPVETQRSPGSARDRHRREANTVPAVVFENVSFAFDDHVVLQTQLHRPEGQHDDPARRERRRQVRRPQADSRPAAAGRGPIFVNGQRIDTMTRARSRCRSAPTSACCSRKARCSTR